jgi:ABC-type phosphate transport system permease subunit
MSKKEIDPTWLSIKLEEYRSLRAEIVDCGSLSISILSFGVLAISGLLSFALTNESLSIFIFLFVCPFICYLMLFIWLGEIVRIFRAASYIRENIEKPINEYFQDQKPPIYWEHWLREDPEKRKKKRLYEWHRAATVILSLATAVISIIIGVFHCYYYSKNTPYEPLYKFMTDHLPQLITFESILFLCIVVLILIIYKNISEWGKKAPPNSRSTST